MKYDVITKPNTAISSEKNNFDRKTLRLRLIYHKVMIETRRYDHTSQDKRFWPVCDSNQTEDEIHFLFHCPKFPALRNVRHRFFSLLIVPIILQ